MRMIRAFALACALCTCAAAGAAPLLPADWSKWMRTTDAALNYRIPGHEDHYRIPYINPVGTAVTTTVKDGKVTWDYPKGTIIVKESYQSLLPPVPGEKPLRLYAMIKDPKNPRARGGWVWVLRDVATKKETVFDSPLCIDCHGYANGPHQYGDRNPGAEFRDFVFFPWRKK
jgi:hypothetical protein